MQSFEPDPRLLETLARLEPTSWSGRVWRHTFADNPPDKANGRGARWNPPGADALYASLERDTALAEAEHQMASQPIRPKAKRTIHQLDFELSSVLDLTDPVLLEGLGVDTAALSRVDFTACQVVGGTNVVITTRPGNVTQYAKVRAALRRERCHRHRPSANSPAGTSGACPRLVRARRRVILAAERWPSGRWRRS